MKIRLGLLVGLAAGYLIGSGKGKDLVSKASAAAGRAPSTRPAMPSPGPTTPVPPTASRPMATEGSNGIVVPAGVVESTPSSLGEP